MAAGIASNAGASARILRNVLSDNLRLVISNEIEAEYYEASSKAGIRSLFARHNVPIAFYRLALDSLCLLAERVVPTGEAPPCRDEGDRTYLHCAQFAAAEFLVTYDHDLLDVHVIGRAAIVTPAQLLQRARDTGARLSR